MTRTFQRVCQCCGTAFISGSSIAKWCSSACTMRAYQRRRRGAPEADPGLALVVQPTAIEDLHELPMAWQDPPASGHEARVWAGTAITRRRSDGFVNATAMCKVGSKRWPDYMRLNQAQAYITALAAVVQIPTTGPKGLIQSVWGGTPDLQGTWIHPRLAIDLARWISPSFAVWMDGWFLESLSRPQQPQQALPLTLGIHVVANSPRHARWLWAQAVEAEVSASLMRSVAERTPAPYQAHLLPSTD
jgi:hypothetical protein